MALELIEVSGLGWNRNAPCIPPYLPSDPRNTLPSSFVTETVQECLMSLRGSLYWVAEHKFLVQALALQV